MEWLTYLLLIPLLGSQDFRTRERVDRQLACHLDKAIVALRIGERSSDPEIAHRCRRLASLYFQANADKLVDAAKPSGGWPLIDCRRLGDWEEPDGEWYLVGWYITEAMMAARPDDHWEHGWWSRDERDRALRHPEAWREATRLYVRDRIAARQPFEAWLLEQRKAEWLRFF